MKDRTSEAKLNNNNQKQNKNTPKKTPKQTRKADHFMKDSKTVDRVCFFKIIFDLHEKCESI